jgi:phospholipase/lecithinase/hemolysin
VDLASWPERRGDSEIPHFQRLFATFNVRLEQTVRQLCARHPGRLLLVDIAGFVQEVVDNPVAFGFANTTDGCLVDGVVCAEPKRYLFWDDVHFSAAFQPLLAERF